MTGLPGILTVSITGTLSPTVWSLLILTFLLNQNLILKYALCLPTVGIPLFSVSLMILWLENRHVFWVGWMKSKDNPKTLHCFWLRGSVFPWPSPFPGSSYLWPCLSGKSEKCCGFSFQLLVGFLLATWSHNLQVPYSTPRKLEVLSLYSLLKGDEGH